MNHKAQFLFIALLPLFTLTSFALDERHQENQAIDCNMCHSCENPTVEDPCLKPCPRAIPMATGDIPDIVIMDELEELYVPVRFNHKLHADMAQMSNGCATCHHHEKDPRNPSSCKTCHPQEIIRENLLQPGLKGAYHRQCLNCHVQWDRQNKCEVCHEKKAGGSLVGSATTHAIHTKHEPITMKELIEFETEFDEDDLVPFHHKRHANKYEENCSVCHQEQSCEACHTHREDSHPMGDLSEIDLHSVCFQCHEEGRCDYCHGQDPDYVFQHETVGWELKPYHEELTCRSCHPQRGVYQRESHNCQNCHEEDWIPEDFDHSLTGVTLGEMHSEMECMNCHVDGITEPARCDLCHEEDMKYDPEIGFGG